MHEHLTNNMIRNFVYFFLLFLTSFPLLAEPVVIVNPQVSHLNISLIEVKRIYAMQLKKWPNDMPIKVFTLADSSKEQRNFVISVLKMQPYQLDRLWKRIIYSGTGKVPKVVVSEDEMIKQVMAVPGAIGFIENPTLVIKAKQLGIILEKKAIK